MKRDCLNKIKTATIETWTYSIPEEVAKELTTNLRKDGSKTLLDVDTKGNLIVKYDYSTRELEVMLNTEDLKINLTEKTTVKYGRWIAILSFMGASDVTKKVTITRKIYDYILRASIDDLDVLEVLMGMDDMDHMSKWCLVWTVPGLGRFYFPKQKYFVERDGERDWRTALLKYGGQQSLDILGIK